MLSDSRCTLAFPSVMLRSDRTSAVSPALLAAHAARIQRCRKRLCGGFLIYLVALVLFAYHWCYRQPYWMRLEMEDWRSDGGSGDRFFWNTTTRVLPRLLPVLFAITMPCFCALIVTCECCVSLERFDAMQRWCCDVTRSCVRGREPRYHPVDAASADVELARP